VVDTVPTNPVDRDKLNLSGSRSGYREQPGSRWPPGANRTTILWNL
jgi:hypothetical protein